MKKHPLALVASYIVLVFIMNACSLPLPGGEASERTIETEQETFRLKAYGVQELTTGIVGVSPHAPIFFPVAGMSSGYSVYLVRPDKGRVAITGRSLPYMPTKEELDSILQTYRFEASPDKTALAIWNEGDTLDYQLILYMLDEGSPFYVTETEVKANIRQNRDWAKVPGIKQVVMKEIEGCSSNSVFWDAIANQKAGGYIDEALLEKWPDCYYIESIIPERVAPGSGASEAWRARALQKAENLLMAGNTEDPYASYRVIVSSQNRPAIDRLDRQLVSKWPGGSSVELVTASRLIGSTYSDTTSSMRVEYIDKLKGKARQIVDQAATDESDVEAAYELADILDDEELLRKVFDAQINAWPAHHQGFMIKHFDELDDDLQERLLAKAEKSLSLSDSEQRYYAFKLLNKEAPCKKLEALQKNYPEDIELRPACALF